MPILQNAREVHLNRCEFRDIQGNYYDHRNAGRQQAIGPEYTRFGGKISAIVEVQRASIDDVSNRSIYPNLPINAWTPASWC